MKAGHAQRDDRCPCRSPSLIDCSASLVTSLKCGDVAIHSLQLSGGQPLRQDNLLQGGGLRRFGGQRHSQREGTKAHDGCAHRQSAHVGLLKAGTAIDVSLSGRTHGSYSARSAVVGSTRAAYHTGSAQAIRAAAASTAGTVTKVTRSF